MTEAETLSAFVRRGAVAGRHVELADRIEVLERERAEMLDGMERAYRSAPEYFPDSGDIAQLLKRHGRLA